MRIKIFIAFVVSSLFIISCKKKDTGTGGGGTTPTETDKPVVTVNKATMEATGFDEVTVTVKDKNGADITGLSNVYANGIILSSNIFTTEDAGVYQITATKASQTSAAVSVTATTPANVHTQKTVVEDYTGAWCGYCPRIAKALEDTYGANANVIPVAVHNGDAFAYSFESQMRAKWGVSGFPTAVLHRNNIWNENGTLQSAVSPYLNKWAKLGIALESTIAGSTISGTAKVKFNVTSTSIPMTIAILLLESGKVLAQTNYYNNTAGSAFQNLGNPIPNFVHNNILRAASTSVFGDIIPQASIVKNTEYSKAFTFNATGYDVTKCDIVAIVSYGDGTTKTGTINAQKVKAGQTKNYD